MGIQKFLILATFIISTFIIWSKYFLDKNAFFTDDFQNQYFPMYYEIGRLISEGIFPKLTNRIYWGNNIAGEFQYGVFNPIHLFFSFGIYQAIQIGLEAHLVATILVYSFFCFTLLVFGFLLLQITQSKMNLLIFLLTLSSNGVLLGWYMPNYVPGFFCFPYFLLFVYSLIKFEKKQKFSLLVPLSIYLSFTSGWPIEILALFITLISYLCILFFYREYWKFIYFSLLSFSAVIASLGSLISLVDYKFYESLRIAWTSFNPPWRIKFQDIVFFVSPFFSKEFIWWDGNPREIHFPMLYISFLFPFVFFIKFHKREKLIFVFWLSFTLLFVLAIVNTLGDFRHLFRILPFFSVIFFLLLALKFHQIVKFQSHLLLFFLSLTAFVNKEIFFGILILGFLFFIQNKRYLYLALCLVVLMNVHYKKSLYLNEMFSISRNQSRIHAAQYLEKRTFFLSNVFLDNNSYFLLGNNALLYSRYSLNGYSALHPKYPSHSACWSWISVLFCSEFGRILEKDPTFKKNLLELVNIEWIVYDKPLETLVKKYFPNGTYETLDSEITKLIISEPSSNLISVQNVQFQVKSLSEYKILLDLKTLSSDKEGYMLLP